MAVVILGPLLSTLDSTVVNVSLSTLARELHSTISTIQWVTSGYLLALALTLPLTGWLVDRIGAKRLYILCFAVFTAASMLCGLAWSTGSLISFRIFQGMAGGLMAPMTQMMVAKVAGRQMARVIGYAALPVLLGPILGPAIAGLILQSTSWRWLFFVNFPVGVLAVALAARFLPKDDRQSTSRSLDLAGLAMLSTGLVALLYGIDHIADLAGKLTFGLALVLLPAFVVYARQRGPSAIIDVSLFRRKTFSNATRTQFLSNGTAFAGQMLAPLYLVLGCHLTPSHAGWLIAPVGLGMICSAPLMGNATERFGIRYVSASGALVALVGTLILAFMAQHEFSLPLLIAAFFIRGMGLGAISIPSVSAAYASIPKADLPMAATSIAIVQRMGGPMLTTFTSIFLAWNLKAPPTTQANFHPFAAAFLLLAAFHALCLISALLLPIRIAGDPQPAQPPHPTPTPTLEALAD
jgi:EmrB/QacA subfamily drug resistance transporter